MLHESIFYRHTTTSPYMTTYPKRIDGRYNRGDWLAGALEVLATEGQSGLQIRELATRMGVSSGSFYWHFENRADFMLQLTEFWEEITTNRIAQEIRSSSGDAKAKLLELMYAIDDGNLSKYDVPMRAWATHDPGVAKVVKRVDKLRSSVVQQLFQEMGFSGNELDMRVTTFVVFHSMEHVLHEKQSAKRRKELTKLRHQFFTTP